MAMFGQYFTYNDGVSSDYGVAIGAFQEVTEIPTGIDRTVTKGEMNRYRSRPNHMGTVYDDVLIFDVTIIKDMCADDYNPLFTRKEYRELVAWLSQPNYPTLFHMVDDEEDVYDEEEWYYGIFSNFEIQSHGGDIIGVTCTFTCDSPFAYSDEITVSFDGDSIEGTWIKVDYTESEDSDGISETLVDISDIQLSETEPYLYLRIKYTRSFGNVTGEAVLAATYSGNDISEIAIMYGYTSSSVYKDTSNIYTTLEALKEDIEENSEKFAIWSWFLITFSDGTTTETEWTCIGYMKGNTISQVNLLGVYYLTADINYFTTFTVDIDTDSEYVYPLILVDFNSIETVRITNNTEDREFSFTPSSIDDITIDCQKLTIYDSNGDMVFLDDVGLSDPSTIEWFRFVPGENEVAIEGDCSVEFTYRECRKVGAY